MHKCSSKRTLVRVLHSRTTVILESIQPPSNEQKWSHQRIGFTFCQIPTSYFTLFGVTFVVVRHGGEEGQVELFPAWCLLSSILYIVLQRNIESYLGSHLQHKGISLICQMLELRRACNDSPLPMYHSDNDCANAVRWWLELVLYLKPRNK